MISLCEHHSSIVCNDVVHHYHSYGGKEAVLKGVSFHVQKGEFVALIGPSGCGKTTLMTLIGGLKTLQYGSLKVLGQELNRCSSDNLLALRSKIGVIFQAHHLMEFLTARQNIQVAMESFPASSFRDRFRRAKFLLDLLGLEGKDDFYPSMLSGGQKQRVACARAIASDPLLILADEPTASLDRSTGQELILTLKRISKERGISMLMSTHDLRVMELADRVIQIDDGRVIG